MANKKKYKIGDIVRLKSGGPSMTVEGYQGIAEEELICQWFAGDKLQSGVFNPDAVEPDDEQHPLGELTKLRKGRSS